MAVVRNTFQPIIPRKRALDEDSYEVEKFKEARVMMSKPKIRFGVQVTRNFPPGCGIMQDSVGSKADTERVPLKNLGNIDSKIEKLASIDMDNELKSLKRKEFEAQKRGFDQRPQGKVKFWDPNSSVAMKSKETTISLKSKELGIQKPGFGSKSAGKVKFWDPSCSVAEKSKETTSSLKPKELGIQKPGFVSKSAGEVKFWNPNCSVADKSKETTSSLKPKESGIQKPGFGSKSAGEVKFWDPNCSVAEKSKETTSSLQPKELGIQRPDFGSRPPGKVKFQDPSCSVDEKSNETTTRLKTKELGLGSRPQGKVKFWDPSCSVDEKSNETTTSLKPKELALGSRPQGKVKFWDPSCSVTEKSSETTIVVSQKEQVRREKINQAMIIFNEVYEKLYLENKSKLKGEKMAHWRVPVEAAKIVKQRMKWINVEKILGPICGVQVGDKFRFRSQLQMIGLHCQPQSGIDYTKIGGKNLAISIVDSNRYSNERESCDVLYYSGQGGVRFLGCKEVVPEDQKLERGNLALTNSQNEKTLVRVIRKLHEVGKSCEVFVYDGLYIVADCTQKKGKEGKMVFMFQLKRVPGQPQLSQNAQMLVAGDTSLVPLKCLSLDFKIVV